MKPSPQRQLLTRYIYVIGPAEGLQKVGLATDPRNRLAALQTACPFDLILHACVAVPFGEARSVEYRAHQILEASRARNEWFETTPAEAVAAIHAAVAQMPGRPVSNSAAAASPPAWRVSPVSQQRPSPEAPSPRLPVEKLPSPPARRAAQLALFDFGRPSPAAPDPAPTPETPIEALSCYRLEVKCCAGLTSYPLRHLASSLPQGGRTPLASAVRLFRCERCRRTAREAVLVGGPGASVAAWRVEGPS